MQTEHHIRRQIVAFAKRTYDKGLVAATDGNISHRLYEDAMLVTPTGSCLGDIDERDIVRVSLIGRVFGGSNQPTSELALHATVYRLRPDVNAAVHAHPPYANAFSFAGLSLETNMIPEVVLTLGNIPTTPYATPASEEGARVIEPFIGSHDAILLQRHGSLTVGATLPDAYYKLEKVEHAALINFAVRQLGSPVHLTPDELRRLAEVGKHLK
jgi:L-fuculose-phosphate aldolase